MSHNKLDSLLRMYYNKSSTRGEKDNALSLFNKLCKKENIDPDKYMIDFNKPRSSWFFVSSAPCTPPTQSIKDSDNIEFDRKWFKIKEIIAEPIIERGQTIIYLSTLCRKRTSHKWGLKSFILYPSTNAEELINKYFKRDNNKLFIIHADSFPAYRGQLVIRKLWIVNEYDTETQIIF